MPNGYASHMSNCVDISNATLLGMKSHDCHVFMESLLPTAFNALREYVWKTLTKRSQFFKDLCSTILCEDKLLVTERNIPVILCELERMFPPGFFNVIEHLPIHVPKEALIRGTVQYRWMYPFER